MEADKKRLIRPSLFRIQHGLITLIIICLIPSTSAAPSLHQVTNIMWPLIGFLVGTATCLPIPPTQHNQSTPFRLASTNTNGMLLSNFHISKEYEKQCQSPLSDILNFNSSACINLHVTLEANHGPAQDNEGWTQTLNKLITPFHMHLARSNTSKQGLASILDESTNSSLYGRESLANGSIQILRFGSSNDPKNRARFFTVF